jgi:hypothetical protein
MLSPEVDPEGKMRPRRHRHLLEKNFGCRGTQLNRCMLSAREAGPNQPFQSPNAKAELPRTPWKEKPLGIPR